MTETAADKSQTTAHSWIEPLYNENVMEKSGVPDMKKDLAGLMIHNPDGSKIIVDMYGYQGHSHMENILPELKEQSASLLNKLQGEPYFILKSMRQGARQACWRVPRTCTHR